MIHEYALEPELVATWHERERFRYFIERFGFDSDGRAAGRVVAQYPNKKWRKQVWEAFNANFGQSASEDERERVTELLIQLTMPEVRRSSMWDDQYTWLENAVEENGRRKFHAILARDNPRNNPQVIRENDVLETDSPPAWRVPREIPILRTATSMATHLEPMLRCATRLLFVDPYFRASEPRWRNPLKEFLKIICDGSRDVTLEYHASACYRNAPSWDYFCKECNNYLPHLIPRDFTLTVRLWKERNEKEKLHNRYILTDIGGVQFGTGLDEGDPDTTDTDDILRLSFELWQQRLEDYGYDSKKFAFDRKISAFDLEGEEPIEGTRT